jgi:cbb3-type cytochrome c oxidase subunit III
MAMNRATRRSCFLAMVLGAAAGAAAQPGVPAANPEPYTRATIARGKTLFLQNCQDCHGEDGKAQGSAIAMAADLTSPQVWKYGQNDAQLFQNIRNGAGDNMPAFGPLGPGLKDQEIWDLVNFIRSLGPASSRPAER